MKPSIHEIAQLACNTKKLNKSDMFHLVRELVVSGTAPDSGQLAQLYSYFLPPVPATPKTPLDWVRKAMARGDVRHYLNYLYVDSGMLLATDGHRMHLSPAPEGMGDGYYNEVGDKVDVDYKYPEWRRVVPTVNTRTPVYITGCEVRDIGHSIGVVINIHGNTWVARKLLTDAVGKDVEVTLLNVGDVNGNAAVLIEVDYGTAVIMPTRMD